MKNYFSLLFIACSIWACGHHHGNTDKQNLTIDSAFQAKRVSRSANITLHAPPHKVFPLFGPVKEKEWAEGWNFYSIYPATDSVDEGFIFQTDPHSHDSQRTTWIISRLDTIDTRIEYTLFSENRVTIIDIKCSDNGNGSTNAKITYTLTALNDKGNDIIEKMLAHMYAHNMIDWEEAIDYYLDKGKMLMH